MKCIFVMLTNYNTRIIITIKNIYHKFLQINSICEDRHNILLVMIIFIHCNRLK